MTKKNIFRIILILLPLIILSILELSLRIIGYDNDLKIVSTIERNGKNYYTMNQLVGKRYFGKDRLYYRKGSHDFFEVNKRPNTIRVFCFGASTMAGFPYEYNAIPSEFLRDRLVEAFPKKNIEVINTAIAATNSFTVVQFAKKLADYKPDLFIVYMGQNEFYGVYGVGSTISIGKSRWMINTYLWLGQFKTFLLIKDLINSVTGLFNSGNPGKNKILMEEMAKNNSIGLNSEDYKTAVNTFRENYKEVIEIAKKNKIPIIISTLVSNQADLKPFVSIHSQSVNDSLRNKWDLFYNEGIKSFVKGDYQNAVNNFSKAVSIDSIPADAHYQLGKCFEKLGDFNFAREEFESAKDLDGLRFRAPSEFNKVIRNLSSNLNVALADVKKEFQKKSINGIIGDNLLADHVHPNIKGYFLMAKSWFNTVRGNNLLGLSIINGFGTQTNNSEKNDSLLWQESSVTNLDSTIGSLKILELRNRPPFKKTDNKFNFNPGNFIEEIAYRYDVQHKISWGNAHLEAAKEYFNRNDYASALRDLKAVLITDEDNPSILKLIGDMYFNLKLYPKAKLNYSKAFSISNNQFIEYKLGLTEYYLGKIDLAIQYFNDCLEQNNYSSQKFNSEELINIHYYSALANITVPDYEKATKELEAILDIDPVNRKAAAMLYQIKNQKNKKILKGKN